VDVPRRNIFWLETSPHCAGIWQRSTRYAYYLECLNICILTTHTSQNIYRKWAKTVNFESMLPDDTKARWEKMTNENVRQSHVDDHFKVATPEDKPQPYSDELLNEAVREWLIETNQVCFFSLTLDFGLTTSSTSRFRLSSIPPFER